MSSKLKTVTRQIDDAAFEVTEVYACTPDEAPGLQTSLWDRIPEGYSGRSAPQCKRVDHDAGFFVRGVKDRIVAQYRTLDNFEFMVRHPPLGILRRRYAARHEEVHKDLDGRTINGIDTGDITGLTRWEVEKGSAFVLRPQAIFTVQAVVNDSSFISGYESKIGYINSTGMPNMTGLYTPFPAGCLLFSRMASQPYRYNKALTIVEYDFMWTGDDKKSWNNMTVSRKFEVKLIKQPVYEETGSAIEGAYREVRALIPRSETRTARLFESTSFGLVDGLLGWQTV